MPTASDVEQALRVADALPPGEEQVERSEKALAMAEQVDDFTLLVQARINLVAAYDAAAPGDREIPHIAWLLGCLEGDPDGPDQVTDRQRFEILWECRYALARTRRSSRMPLVVVQRVFRDIERRYRAEKVSPHLYAKYRAFLARDIDTDEVLERWLEVWRTSPRDALSDCEVCDIAVDARFLAEAGDPAAALERAVDLLEGRKRCDREPHRLYGEAADWAMRLGKVDTAEAYHRAGWLMVAGRPPFASAMAEHVMYLVRSNRPGRAVRLALALVPLLDDRLDDLDRMRGCAVAARVLRAGRGHRLAPPVVSGRPLDDVIRSLDGSARELAAAFDRRNRTDRVSRGVSGLVRIAPYPESASEDVRAVDALEVDLARRAEVPFEPPSVPLPDSVLGFAAELLAVSDRFDATRVMELVNGWASVREQMLPVGDPVEHLAVSYLDRRALASERAQDDEGFVDALLASASESARMSGSVPAIQRVEVESLHRQALAGDEAAWPRARKLADELEAAGELTEAAGALMALSRNPDPARGMHDALRAAELFDRAGQPRWAVTALQAAGYAGVWADPAASEPLLQRAYDGAMEHRLPALAVAITATRAKLAWQTGNIDAAVLGFREAVARADEVGVADPLGLRSELCDVLLQAHEWEELIDEAHALLARLAPGDVQRRAFAHRLLGLGLLETGNAHEAVEVLEPAVVALRQDDPMLAVASWTLGRALVASERPDLAAPHFVTAAAGFQADQRLPDAAAAHEAAGLTLFQLGSHGRAAEHLVNAARIARHVGDQQRMVSSLRLLANVQGAEGRVNEALSTLRSIVDEARAVPPADPAAPPLEEERLRGQTQHQAALILIDGNRAEEAEAALDEAIPLLTQHGEGTETAAAEDTYHRLTGRMWTAPRGAREDRAGGNN